MKYLNWENCINQERNEIVFENKNKEFGAYVLRRDYSKNAFIAFCYSSVLIAALVLIPFLNRTADEILADKTNDKVGEVYLEDFVFPPLPAPPITTEVLQKHIIRDAVPVIVKDPLTSILPVAAPSIVQSSTTPGLTDLSGPVQNSQSIIIPDEKEDIPRSHAEIRPEFPGGDAALVKYLSENIKYPSKAKSNDIQGKVYITFVVGKDGKVKDVQLLHGIGGNCDEEAMRVVKNMPTWSPAKQSGEAVSFQFNLPVQFSLR